MSAVYADECRKNRVHYAVYQYSTGFGFTEQPCLFKSLCTKKKKYQLVNKGRETSGHIHDTKHLTRSRCKGQFTTAANTAVKLQRRVAADSKQQLACPTGPNEH